MQDAAQSMSGLAAAVRKMGENVRKNLTSFSISVACEQVGANMSTVSDHDSGIHVVFFLRVDCGADKERAVLANIEQFRQWLDGERPAGVHVNIIVRYVTADALAACKSVEAMAGAAEALKQVFGLDTTGDWTP
jgi:hypothetical protein